jgi:hypothetical protein
MEKYNYLGTIDIMSNGVVSANGHVEGPQSENGFGVNGEGQASMDFLSESRTVSFVEKNGDVHRREKRHTGVGYHENYEKRARVEVAATAKTKRDRQDLSIELSTGTPEFVKDAVEVFSMRQAIRQNSNGK